MKKSESIAELAKALSAFQGEVKQPMKDKDNPFFKSRYVPLENVVEAITGTAHKHGLSFTQFPVNQDDKVGVVTILMHSSGEWIETDPVYARPSKNDAQATGSVITYLKRYSLSAVFGITSDEDDDGNAGGQQPNQYQNNQRPNNPPPQNNAPSKKQMDMIKAKTNTIAQRDSIGQGAVYDKAKAATGINKPTNELNKNEASKIIEYLITMEG